jgi:hypothetical protein
MRKIGGVRMMEMKMMMMMMKFMANDVGVTCWSEINNFDDEIKQGKLTTGVGLQSLKEC